MRLKLLSARKRPSKEGNDLCNRLRAGSWIPRGTAESQQETDVTTDAVADCAKARQVDEKAFLKDGGQRIIEVSGLGETPQFFGDLEGLGRKTEKIGKDPESLFYATRKIGYFISH